MGAVSKMKDLGIITSDSKRIHHWTTAAKKGRGGLLRLKSDLSYRKSEVFILLYKAMASP